MGGSLLSPVIFDDHDFRDSHCTGPAIFCVSDELFNRKKPKLFLECFIIEVLAVNYDYFGKCIQNIS